MRRFDLDDFMNLRRPADGPPVPNQGGIPAPTGPKRQVVVPNRAGSNTGRPPSPIPAGLPPGQERAGRFGVPQPPAQERPSPIPAGLPPGQERAGRFGVPQPPVQRRAQEIEVSRDDQGRVTGTSGLTPDEQAEHDRRVAGGMKSGEALASMFGKKYGRLEPGAEGGQKPQPEREVARGGYTGGKEAEQEPLVPRDETGTQLQPGGVPSKQLPGVEQKPEYTVARPMSHQEIQSAPDGVINTPHAIIEKGPDGIQVKGLTEMGKQRIEQLRQADMSKFKGWGNELDPNAPPPPIRPGMRAFNPMTGEWINNENSILEQLGGE